MKTYILALILTALASVILLAIFTPLLKKLKLKQSILSYVEVHKSKNGTPTMAGVFFTASAIIFAVIFAVKPMKLSLMAISIILAFTVVGFLDDFLKVYRKQNLGLTATQKFAFQLIISLVASYYAYLSGLDFLFVPFSNKTINLGVFSIFFNAIVFIATVNGANLTDGLDGLLASVSTVIFGAFSLIIFFQIYKSPNLYIYSYEYKNLALIGICFLGALLGYLVFNTNKASIFMGDTGSLTIGGCVSVMAIFSGNALYIPIICVMYLISALSVIIQVIYFKRTKKRIFLMAPIHHHVQMKGYSEGKIAYAYTFITLILSLAVILWAI